MADKVKQYGVNVTFGGYAVMNPRRFYEECQRFGWPTDWISKANKFTCPPGSESGRGWLLMINKDVKALLGTRAAGINGNELLIQCGNNTLRIGSISGGTSRGLYIADSTALTSSDPEADNQVMLVEIVDVRAILNKIPAHNLITDTFGVRFKLINSAVKTNGTLLESGSSSIITSGGDYGDLAEAIWETYTELGAFPGFPSDFSRDSLHCENFRYTGTSGLEALEQLLNSIGCTLIYKVTHPQKWTIALLDDQTTNSYNDGPKEEARVYETSYEPQSMLVVPESVVVCFHRYYMDLIGPASNGDPYYSVTKTRASMSGDLQTDPLVIGPSYPGTREYIYDDMMAVYGGIHGASGTYGLINETELGTRATERARQFYQSYLRGTLIGGLSTKSTGIFDPLGDGHTSVRWRDVTWSMLAGDDGVFTTIRYGRRPYPKPAPFPAQRLTQMVWVEMQENMPSVTSSGAALCSGAWGDGTTEYGFEGWLVDRDPGSADHWPVSDPNAAVSDDFRVDVYARFFNGAAFAGNGTDKEGDRVLCLVLTDTRGSQSLYAVTGGTTFISGEVTATTDEYATVKVTLCSGHEISIHSANVYGKPEVGHTVGCLWNNKDRRFETGLEACA